MTADEIRAAYAANLQEHILVRRYTGSGTNRPRFDIGLRAETGRYKDAELIGTIQQGDRKIILLYDDLLANKFVLPLTSSDKIIDHGKELSIISLSERMAQDGTMIAYEIQARG